MITYFKKTLEYLFVIGKGKRFSALMLIMLPLGLALALFMPNTIYSYKWSEYQAGNTDFLAHWNMHTHLNYWILLLIVFILGVIAIAIVTTVVSRSLRVGTFKIKHPFKEMNENVFSSFFFMVYILFTLLCCKVLLTLLLVLAGSLTFSNIVSYIVVVISLLATAIIFHLIVSMQLLVLPTMAINGVKLKSASLSSIRKCGANLGKIFGAIAIPYIFVAVIGVLVSITKILWLHILVDTLLYSAYAVYFVVLSLIVYYEIEQIKREDYSTNHFIGGEIWGK